jgi:hypothetical protein
MYNKGICSLQLPHQFCALTDHILILIEGTFIAQKWLVTFGIPKAFFKFTPEYRRAVYTDNKPYVL